MTARPKRTGYVSPSQMKTYLDCPRKWAYQYVDGLRGPPNRYAEYGVQTHDVLEQWMLTGKAPNLNTDIGQTAFAILKHLPKPHPKRLTEQEIMFSFDKVLYLGYADLHDLEEAPDTLVTYDYKTTSGFGWALDEESLAEDIQWVTYAFGGVLKYERPKLIGRWVYGLSKPPYKSKPVEVRATAAEIFDRFEVVHKIGKEVVRAKSRPSAAAEQNFAACEAYGGCPFRERCHGNMTAMDRARAIFAQGERAEEARAEQHAPEVKGQTKMGLLNRVKSDTTNGTNGAAKTEGPPPGTTAEATETGGKDFLARMKERIAQGKADTPAASETIEPTPEEVEANNARLVEEQEKKNKTEGAGRGRGKAAATGTATPVVHAGIGSSTTLWGLTGKQIVHAALHIAGVLTGRPLEAVQKHWDAWQKG
jgi:hypothetical protein